MKTSIIYKWGDRLVQGSLQGWLRRGRLPGEVPEGAPDDAARTAHFRPAHTEERQTFNPNTLKIGAKKKRRLPDAISIGSHRFFLERGKTDEAVVIPPDYVSDLDALDEHIRKLERERKELVEEAFRHGRPLRKADVVGPTCVKCGRPFARSEAECGWKTCEWCDQKAEAGS